MFENILKKDKNEELEKILEEKEIDEQAKNLLQGILYKIEVSYKDYKKAKVTSITKDQYINEILENIQKRCNKIKTISLRKKLEDEKIQKGLEKNKFYIGKDEIITYPIEEKLLYAIEKKSNTRKVVNSKYGVISPVLSDFINTGKSIDRVEVLRDFNGFSWTTIKTEIENINANLVYQLLRIILGEEFLYNWSQDTDGIIDYVKELEEEITKKYGKELSKQIKEKMFKIAIFSNEEKKKEIKDELTNINKKLQELEDAKEYVSNMTERKKEALKEISEIDKILSQESKVREKYNELNRNSSLENKIFSVKVLKQQLKDKKIKLLSEIEECNNILKPNNYVREKKKLEKEKNLFEVINYTNKQKEEELIEFIKLIFTCFKKQVKTTKEEDIIKMIYKFRYVMILPFNTKFNVKDIEELENDVLLVEKVLMTKAIENKIISKEMQIEIMGHVLKTRIVKLEELYYKIENTNGKFYVQIFDDNINEEKFEIPKANKINKKVKIFI